MAYTITVKVLQENSDTVFNVTEKITYPGCSWKEVGCDHVLSMKSSGTSGSIRFADETGENFVFTLGVHNYKPWGDIVPQVPDGRSADLNLEYYETAYQGTENPERVAARWKTMASDVVVHNGHGYGFEYTVTDGHNLKVDVKIL